MNLAESALGKSFLEQLVRFLVKNPERNLPLIVKWGERAAKEEHHKRAVSKVREIIADKNSNWYRFITNLVSVHPNIRERVAVNFFLNATLLGVPRQKEAAGKLGVSVPWAVLMDPTEKCNLNCTGCWAGQYEREDLEFEVMDRVCSEAEELGIYAIIISGGEPLVRGDDLVRLAARHPDQIFHVFTNGTLIDKTFVEQIITLGNIIPALSIEGLEENTDRRRGRGVFKRLMHSMDLLRENGCLFGISTTYTRGNTEELAGDAFIDLMVAKGALFAWYFTYVSVGGGVDFHMMAAPEQRKYMFERIKYFRRTKPFFIADFWNDGEAVSGCIAGGRRYFHINARGAVEPCAFIHYSTCNIKEVSLREALQNPLFKAYQKRQPFNSNMLCPCPLIDNPEMLREMVHESGARPTQSNACDQDVDTLALNLRCYADAWQRVASACR